MSSQRVLAYQHQLYSVALATINTFTALWINTNTTIGVWCFIQDLKKSLKMPLFGSTFSPKKIPPRKSASLSSLHTVSKEETLFLLQQHCAKDTSFIMCTNGCITMNQYLYFVLIPYLQYYDPQGINKMHIVFWFIYISCQYFSHLFNCFYNCFIFWLLFLIFIFFNCVFVCNIYVKENSSYV